MKLPPPAQMRKALVAVATALAQALALGLVPEKAQPWVLLVLAVLGAYGVFAIKNEPATT